MPGKNGMGPLGQGPVSRGAQRRASWGGTGPGGNCVCPDCGEKIPHKPGTPCTSEKCPKCGSKMLREKAI